MPQIHNKKQELFCRFVAEGETYTQAYELAGYTPSTSNSSVLANKPDIAARIAELKAEKQANELEFRVRLAEAKIDPDENAVTEVIQWTIQKVLDALSENARLAQIAGEFGAAHKSLELIGKALGMFDSKNPKDNDGNAPRTQVSLTLVQQALGEADGGGGPVPANGRNPLAPKLSRTRDAEPVE